MNRELTGGSPAAARRDGLALSKYLWTARDHAEGFFGFLAFGALMVPDGAARFGEICLRGGEAEGGAVDLGASGSTMAENCRRRQWKSL